MEQFRFEAVPDAGAFDQPLLRRPRTRHGTPKYLHLHVLRRTHRFLQRRTHPINPQIINYYY